MARPSILVTGGLGFIGSHTAVCLHEAGYEPILLDNLSNSNRSALDGISSLMGYTPTFIEGDVCDPDLLRRLFEEHNIEATIHFAAFKAVGESITEPLKYYQNNMGGLMSLLEVMKETGKNKVVFSSSCTVYGEPDQVPVTESSPTKEAESPYGATKQMGERVLRDMHWAEVQCLRYFNPIGAHPSATIGELPLGVPNNLIPYLTQTVAGIRQELTVFGGDYDTPDGTCIRDYIHVMDLAEAHVVSLKRLLENQAQERFEVFNIGTGDGYSVLDVINTFEKVNGFPVPHRIGERRDGDVIQVWADTSRVNSVLGWKTQRGLEDMLRDAWRWQQRIASQ
ncbi:MAG: UDP-glucose 4-epimerase GalE [Bacteroidetes bacterium]|nr:UDP-glucose 4-epimerase GalE [Bacteroidota bacterium]